MRTFVLSPSLGLFCAAVVPSNKTERRCRRANRPRKWHQAIGCEISAQK
jgi:hypothetical protein